MNLKHTVFAVAAGALALGATATAAAAQTPFEHNHPRQAQVLHRSEHQRMMIRHAEASGRISHRKAEILLAKERRLAANEHRMAVKNGGYLTPAQQHRLNRHEARLGRQIRG